MTRGGMWRLLACIGIAGFVLLPLVQAIVLSFTTTLATEAVPQGSIGLHNYANILRSPELRASIGNSIIYVLLNVAFCLIAGLPAAYGLARFTFLGDRHFLMFLLAFRVTPPVVLSLPIFILFARSGLVNSPIGIACSTCQLQFGYLKASSQPFHGRLMKWPLSTGIAGLAFSSAF